MDTLLAINDALHKDLAGFQTFITDTLHASKTTPNIYTLPDGGTITFRDGWVEVSTADGKRFFGNLRGGLAPQPAPQPAPAKQEPEDIKEAIFDHLFNGGDLQDLPHEHIEELSERRNSTLSQKAPTGETVRIHIGDKGIITATRLYPGGWQERAGYWLPPGLVDLGEDEAFTTSCLEQCMLHAPVREAKGRGR